MNIMLKLVLVLSMLAVASADECMALCGLDCGAFYSCSIEGILCVCSFQFWIPIVIGISSAIVLGGLGYWLRRRRRLAFLAAHRHRRLVTAGAAHAHSYSAPPAGGYSAPATVVPPQHGYVPFAEPAPPAGYQGKV